MIDADVFRSVLALFPSGVAVVTATDDAGVDYGLTLTAFCSISATPPLVAISLDTLSNTLPVVKDVGGFSVNFLDHDHEGVARRFASKEGDKFAGLALKHTSCGGPILEGHACAYLVCTTFQEIPAGDHHLIVGEVREADVLMGRTPLLYGRRRFSGWIDPPTRGG